MDEKFEKLVKSMKMWQGRYNQSRRRLEKAIEECDHTPSSESAGVFSQYPICSKCGSALTIVSRDNTTSYYAYYHSDLR